MTKDRISVRVDRKLRRRLNQQAAASGRGASTVVRAALEEYLSKHGKQETCYDAFLRAGMIGAIKNGPRDLSTNKKHFRGFGR